MPTVEMTLRLCVLPLFVKFVSPANVEMKQERARLNSNKKQITSGIWIAGGNMNIKALGCFNHRAGFRKIAQCLMNTLWVKGGRADPSDLNVIGRDVDIHLPSICLVCDPSAIVGLLVSRHPQVSPNKQHFNVQQLFM